MRLAVYRDPLFFITSKLILTKLRLTCHMFQFLSKPNYLLMFRSHCLHAVCRCGLCLQVSHLVWSAMHG